MTRQEFEKLTQNLIFLDGATGSNLIAAGMPRGTCTEAWILEHPDIFSDLQKAYVDAGSNIVYAPTFGANRMSLSLHGLENQIEKLNHQLVAISRNAVGNQALVAGDLTTSGKILSADGEYTYDTAFQLYTEQIRYLADAGVDLLVAETMISIDETLAALDAASQICSLPVICTVTVEADGSIFTGGNAIDAAVAFEGAGASAVGVNCSVGPDQLVSVIRNIRENVSIPVIAKPNAGMPHITDQGNAVYDMDAEMFANHMKVLVQNGASIIGGCCGTTPAFIRATTRLLKG